jgi:hypothetical protein
LNTSPMPPTPMKVRISYGPKLVPAVKGMEFDCTPRPIVQAYRRSRRSSHVLARGRSKPSSIQIWMGSFAIETRKRLPSG